MNITSTGNTAAILGQANSGTTLQVSNVTLTGTIRTTNSSSGIVIGYKAGTMTENVNGVVYTGLSCLINGATACPVN